MLSSVSWGRIAVGDGTKNRHEVFIAGETTDLCVPSDLAIEQGWGRWFNDPKTTRHLGHGVFPNDDTMQREFLGSIRDRSRFALMICSKGGEKLYGVISLSTIDWVARSAQIALVVGESLPSRKLMQLEAMALVTDHAFEKMGMRRVWAGQAYPALSTWTSYLELIGYMVEGVHRDGFAKGRAASKTVSISCALKDYEAIVQRRGALWPGNEKMLALIKARPKVGLADKLAGIIAAEQESHAKLLAASEASLL